MSSLLNRAAVRRHALRVSKETRAGKFTRVSEDFINQVEAELGALARKLVADLPNVPGGTVQPEDGERLLSPAGADHLAAAINIWLAHEVQRKAAQIRTGKTL